MPFNDMPSSGPSVLMRGGRGVHLGSRVQPARCHRLIVALQIVRNHIIPETLTYFKLEQLTETGMPARYASLGDAVWEFTFFTTEGAVDGTVVLMDTYNVTQERADDILFMQWDISNAKQGDWCDSAGAPIAGARCLP